ncbi:MAG: hybrid sensor histidine kinase/response regulator [Nitrospirae bacterium]|nr:hybrid sensor histidine kinase/response regulator [Nitrospirota bacterium]MBF0540884.1 hybrid sensor histidine kinase/response regulator [Nitrospirota bacterium]
MEIKDMKILIVDDDLFTSEMLAEILKDSGFNVLTANNGLNAIEVHNQNTDLKLIVSDMNMPEMNGLELIKKIREAKSSIPIIILTGNNEISIAIEAINSGANDYLLKDENIQDTIIMSVNKVLEKQAMKEQNERLLIDLSIKNKELESTLDELKTSQERLVQSEKMASLGLLVAGVAHEINTPVGVCTTAISHLHKMTKEITTSLNEQKMKKSDLTQFLTDSNEYCDIITKNLFRTSELVKSFKMVSADQTSSEKRVFNVKSYIEDILLSLSPKLKVTTHKLEINCPNDIEIDSYPGAFAQIITNLIMNSLIHAYSQEDSGIITIAITSNESEIFIDYSDNGKGIPEENLKKIFDPFFTTKRGSGGTGLGLHVVYNIICQTLKGGISCESVLGKGTTFKINLPKILNIAQ